MFSVEAGLGIVVAPNLDFSCLALIAIQSSDVWIVFSIIVAAVFVIKKLVVDGIICAIGGFAGRRQIPISVGDFVDFPDIVVGKIMHILKDVFEILEEIGSASFFGRKG